MREGGGKGIKHLTKMSRVFGGWFLEGVLVGLRVEIDATELE